MGVAQCWSVRNGVHKEGDVSQSVAGRVMPMITVSSVDAIRNFYVDTLGFHHVMGMVGKDGQLDFCTVVMGEARVMFMRAPGELQVTGGQAARRDLSRSRRCRRPSQPSEEERRRDQRSAHAAVVGRSHLQGAGSRTATKSGSTRMSRNQRRRKARSSSERARSGELRTMADINTALRQAETPSSADRRRRARGCLDAPRAPGKWSPSQIIEHVARSLEESANMAAGRPSKFPSFLP